MFDASSIFSGISSGIGAIGSYIAAQKKAESDRKWQEYNNKMTRLQDAQNQNSITTNENMRKERKAQQLFQVQKAENSTVASAEVSAASTGTIGRSVDMVLYDVHRNAAVTREQIEKDDRNQDAVTDNQRMSSALQTELQIDKRQIQDPSTASLLLGLGTAGVSMLRTSK
jgi:hypothetical protein